MVRIIAALLLLGAAGASFFFGRSGTAAVVAKHEAATIFGGRCKEDLDNHCGTAGSETCPLTDCHARGGWVCLGLPCLHESDPGTPKNCTTDGSAIEECGACPIIPLCQGSLP